MGSSCSSATLDRRTQSAQRQTGNGVALLPGSKEFKNDYMERAKIKEGTKAIEVMQKGTNQTYVLRKLPLKDIPMMTPQAIAEHCSALESLEHPHLCKFVEGFQDKNEVFLIYEKADCTTLLEHVREEGHLKEIDVADYVRQVTMVLALAHSHKIYHGRLSPSKIILSFPTADDEEGEPVQIKICDMGQAYVLRCAPDQCPATAKGYHGERFFMSHELLVGDLSLKEEGSFYPNDVGKTDMWALGTIAYNLLTGSLPFQHCKDRDELAKALQSEFIEFNHLALEKLSPEARDCMDMLLKVNPKLRPNAHQLLKHPFISIAKTSFPKKRMVQLLNNLKINAQNCEFTRFVVRVIAEQLPTDGQQAVTVEKCFRCLDTDGDGVLSTHEIVRGLEKYLGLKQEEQEELFSLIDRDGSGTLNVSEFISATMDQRRAKSLPVLWQAFNAFDRDQGGTITFDEMDSLVMELEGALSSKDQLRELCEQIRRELSMVSFNETIDFDQFVYILQNNEPTTGAAMRRELSRFLWSTCQVDCHDVRKTNSKKLNLERVGLAVGSRSAYRKNFRNTKTKKAKSKSNSPDEGSTATPSTAPAQAG